MVKLKFNKKVILIGLIGIVLITTIVLLFGNSWKKYKGYSEVNVNINSNQELSVQIDSLYSKIFKLYEYEKGFEKNFVSNVRPVESELFEYNKLVGEINGIIKSVEVYQGTDIDEFGVQYPNYFADFEELFLYRMFEWNDANEQMPKSLNDYIVGLDVEADKQISISEFFVKPKILTKVTESNWETSSDATNVLLFGKKAESQSNFDLDIPIFYKSYLQYKYREQTEPLFMISKIKTNESHFIPEGEWEFYIQIENSFPSFSWLSSFPSPRKTYIVAPQIGFEMVDVENNTGSMTPHILKYSSEVIDSEDFNNKYYSN